MKVYVVYCHPDPESFTSAVFQRTLTTLTACGHDVRTSDLYADEFEPTLSLQEWLDHRAPISPPADIASYCANLTWCEALVFVYPTWWSGQPAMLNGWLDRVLVRGVAWDVTERATRVTGRLTNVRRIVAITTHGSSKVLNTVQGESGKRVIARAVRVLCYQFARSTWLAMYNMDRSTVEQRTAFLDRVERRIRRL
ncbi:MAG TPA: NAD(P)H-dependent oxidoreductase [Ilumatobacteraceae bacterium]